MWWRVLRCPSKLENAASVFINESRLGSPGISAHRDQSFRRNVTDFEHPRESAVTNNALWLKIGLERRLGTETNAENR